MGKRIEAEKTYAELLRDCLENRAPNAPGFGIKEMKQRIEIMDVLEKANGTIELENAQAEKVKEVVKEMQWLVISKDILEFCETVIAL